MTGIEGVTKKSEHLWCMALELDSRGPRAAPPLINNVISRHITSSICALVSSSLKLSIIELYHDLVR